DVEPLEAKVLAEGLDVIRVILEVVARRVGRPVGVAGPARVEGEERALGLELGKLADEHPGPPGCSTSGGPEPISRQASLRPSVVVRLGTTAILKGASPVPWRHMHRMRASVATAGLDYAIAALAAKQYGVVTRRQLGAVGLRRGAIGRSTSSGRCIACTRRCESTHDRPATPGWPLSLSL